MNRLAETQLRLLRKPDTDEWVVRVYVNGRYDDDKSYYTDDKHDAIETMARMKKEMGITSSVVGRVAAESEVVFHASSRGGRWELVGYADGKYEDLKHGKVTGSGGAFSRMGLTHKLAAMVQDSKIIDGINYIIDVDKLGVKQLLSKIDLSKSAPAEFYRIGTNINKESSMNNRAVARELTKVAKKLVSETDEFSEASFERVLARVGPRIDAIKEWMLSQVSVVQRLKEQEKEIEKKKDSIAAQFSRFYDSLDDMDGDLDSEVVSEKTERMYKKAISDALAARDKLELLIDWE